MRMLVLMAVGVATVAALPATATTRNTAVADAVAAFNRSEFAVTKLKIAGEVNAPWSPTSGTLPASLASVPMSQREAEALTAAVAAYGVDQQVYPSGHRPSALAYLVGMAASMAVENAYARNERVWNGDKWQSIAAPGTGKSRAVPRFSSPKDRLTKIVVGFGTCAGALVSAVNRLKVANGDAQLVRFAQAVRDDASWQAVPADADCSG